jgi:hypothetical protein
MANRFAATSLVMVAVPLAVRVAAVMWICGYLG